MSAELNAAVRAALGKVVDPELRRPITEVGMVKDVTVESDGAVHVEIYLTTSACPKKTEITDRVTAAVTDVPGTGAVKVTLDVMNDEQRAELRKQLARACRPQVQQRAPQHAEEHDHQGEHEREQLGAHVAGAGGEVRQAEQLLHAVGVRVDQLAHVVVADRRVQRELEDDGRGDADRPADQGAPLVVQRTPVDRSGPPAGRLVRRHGRTPCARPRRSRGRCPRGLARRRPGR